MYIFFILANGLTLFQQFWLKELFILILLLGGFWLRRWRLHLAMNDLIDRHVGVLILILLLSLLFVVKLIPLCHLLQFLVIVRVMLGVMLQPNLHILHPPV